MGWFQSKQKETVASSASTLLGSGTIFEGSLRVEGNICIEGTFRGTLESRASVVVTKDGRMEADVVAEYVAVHGLIQGSITARKGLHVGETGRILGDVVAGSITVACGGRLEGQCRMRDEPSAQTQEAAEEVLPGKELLDTSLLATQSLAS